MIESNIAHRAFEFLHGEAELTGLRTFGTTSYQSSSAPLIRWVLFHSGADKSTSGKFARPPRALEPGRTHAQDDLLICNAEPRWPMADRDRSRFRQAQALSASLTVAKVLRRCGASLSNNSEYVLRLIGRRSALCMNCVRLCSRQRAPLSARNRSKRKYQDNNPDNGRCPTSGAHAIRAHAIRVGAIPSHAFVRHVFLAKPDLPNTRFPIGRYIGCPMLRCAGNSDLARRNSRPAPTRVLATALLPLPLTIP